MCVLQCRRRVITSTVKSGSLTLKPTGDVSSGADTGDDVVDAVGEVGQDLLGRGLGVHVDVGRVVELLRHPWKGATAAVDEMRMSRGNASFSGTEGDEERSSSFHRQPSRVPPLISVPPTPSLPSSSPPTP